MPNPEEDTYSIIFTSLKHPIRRKILRMLSGKPRSFSEMQEAFKIESSHLTYHLESLGSLHFKNEEGKYALSSLGEAAVSMIHHVEESPKAKLHLPLSSKRWKILLATSMVGLILLSSLCYFQYQTITQLSGQYLSLKQDQALLQKILKEVLGLENAVLTYEYVENSTVATALFMINETTLWHVFRSPWGRNIDSYFIYSLTGNSTLEIEISFPSSDQAETCLFVTVGKEMRNPGGLNYSITCNGTTTHYYHNESICYEGIWGMSITNSSTYSVTIPSRGWYMILTEAPKVRNTTNHYITNYTIAFQVKGQKNYIPFFVGSRMGCFGITKFWGDTLFIPEQTPERRSDP